MNTEGGTTRRLAPGWIVGPRVDAGMFTGSLLAGLAIVVWFASLGRLHDPVPAWLFVVLVACVDVAHVYATAFRVYLDPARFRQRPALYIGVPVLALAAGQVAYAASPATFWRVLAYLAVYHFVRQQWGWVAYTRRRAGEGAVDRRLDMAVTYAATVVPLIHWHTTLPREIAWFVDGDFAGLPAFLGPVAWAASLALHLTFVARQVVHTRSGRGVNWAKVQVVATTSLAWFLAIVAFDSDVAFTALNVLGHGVPYLVVVWHVERRVARCEGSPCARLFRPGVAAAALFLGLLAFLGYGEEWLWDQLVWLERPGAFPVPFSSAPDALPVAASLVVPLLAVPQATHYLLDGWLWRVSGNADVAGWLGAPQGERT